MSNIIRTKICSIVLLTVLQFPSLKLNAQRPLKSQDLAAHSTYFLLDSRMVLEGVARKLLSDELKTNHFVGLAELHQSHQLSFFTTALLKLLAENDFKHFALELGPYSAKIVTQASSNPESVQEEIRNLNSIYGKKLYQMTPLIFVNRQEDALFVSEAARNKIDFWGLDQEFIYSFEMHVDNINTYQTTTIKDTELYNRSKLLLRKWGRKAARSRKFNYNCALQENKILDVFFRQFADNTAAMEHINALKTSWDIYCKNEQGLSSNQQRADYMKALFDHYYEGAVKSEENPRIFAKFGSVHLTKGVSPFGVNDLGLHLSELAVEKDLGFVNIRHLRRFRNGKDLMKNKDWQGVSLLMSLGKRDSWVLIDLRPIRKRVQQGELTASKTIRFEIDSYDFILIPPNDKRSKLNF